MTVPEPKILTLLLGAVLAACGQGPAATVQTTPAPATRNASPPSAIAQARADSARHPYTAADIDFMSGMISHHAQAIVMARWAPSHEAGPAIRRLAERIINAQEDEIVTMQTWLRDRSQPVPQVAGGGAMMMVDGVAHDMMMPGMLSETQMRALDQARGTEFDRLFLTYMIQHHRGAVTMVAELFSSHGAGQDGVVFKFAADVNVDQATEIARMERMLVSLMLDDPSL